jgi:hypothetical protein
MAGALRFPAAPLAAGGAQERKSMIDRDEEQTPTPGNDPWDTTLPGQACTLEAFAHAIWVHARLIEQSVDSIHWIVAPDVPPDVAATIEAFEKDVAEQLRRISNSVAALGHLVSDMRRIRGDA